MGSPLDRKTSCYPPLYPHYTRKSRKGSSAEKVGGFTLILAGHRSSGSNMPTHMPQYHVNYRRVSDEGQYPHLAAAMWAEQGILQPDPLDELGPLCPLLPLEGGGFLNRHQEVHLTPLPFFHPATR